MLAAAVFPLAADGDQYINGFFFYIPSQAEADDYFRFRAYLEQADKNGGFDEEVVPVLFERFWNDESMHSLLFENFLLTAENPGLRKQVLDHIKTAGLSDSAAKAVGRKYEAEKTSYKMDGKTQYRYNWNDKYFDENFNLHALEEIYPFEGGMGMLIFDNDWSIMTMNQSDSGEALENQLYFVYGGGTNSMFIALRKFPDIAPGDFKSKVVDADTGNSQKYENWKIAALPAAGVLERAGASQIYLGCGTGPDIIPEIDTATFVIYMYSEEQAAAYKVNYFMNFSVINNGYEMRRRIYNHIMLNLNFVFVP